MKTPNDSVQSSALAVCHALFPAEILSNQVAHDYSYL